MDTKQLPREFHTSFRSKEGAVEKLQGIYDERRRTQERKLMNTNADLRGEKARAYGCGATAEDRRRFFGRAQGDAAANIEDNGECCGSGGAREAERWREDGRKKKKEEGLTEPIYKGISEQAGAKTEEDQNNDYPANLTPRFSEDIKR